MSTNFSSLENTNILFNYLINSNKDASSLKHISKLLNNLTTLLNEADHHDVEIKIGEGQHAKIFKAHYIILNTRSAYFKTVFSKGQTTKSKDGIILFEKQNISPKIFEILLSYIYNGIVNINDLNQIEILELLEACDELDIDELVTDLQNYLIKEEQNFFRQNLIYIQSILLKHQSFHLLQNHFKELITDSPYLFLKTQDFKDIGKPTFMSILKKDNLGIDEIDIWDYVIQWGIGQNKGLKKDITMWNKDDFFELKSIIEDILPLIRFNQISSYDFYAKIKPYKKVFAKEVYEELLQYHIVGNFQPNIAFQQGSRSGARNLLNLEIKSLIFRWISGVYNEKIAYDFKLILCGSQHGFSRSVFEDKCYNIEETVVIMKIKETGELVGGYNPVCWNNKEQSSDETYFIETDNSFIFKIDEKQINNSILSRVKDPQKAIFHSKQNVEFTKDNIKFNETPINFCDLALINSINKDPYCYFNGTSDFYDTKFNLNNKSKKVHLMEELEVYKFVNNWTQGSTLPEVYSNNRKSTLKNWNIKSMFKKSS